MPTSKTSDTYKPRPKSGGNVVKSLKSSPNPKNIGMKTGGSSEKLSHSAEKSKRLLKIRII